MNGALKLGAGSKEKSLGPGPNGWFALASGWEVGATVGWKSKLVGKAGLEWANEGAKAAGLLGTKAGWLWEPNASKDGAAAFEFAPFCMTAPVGITAPLVLVAARGPPPTFGGGGRR